MPGPDNLYVLTESLSRGPKQGIGITTGLISGVIVHTLLVASGFSLLIYQFEWLYDLVKYTGAAYLLYLAVGAYREAPAAIESSKQGQAEPFVQLIRRGFLMNVLNPKVTVFFVAFLPQFVSGDGWPPFLQMCVLGGLFMLVSYAVFGTLAVLSGKAASMVTRPAFWWITRWVKVLVLTALAILLALSSPA